MAFRPRPVAFGLSFFRCFRKSARFATALPLMKEETPELTRADKLTSLQGYILWCVKPFTISSCSVNSASDSCHILGRSPWFLFNLASRYCNKSLCSWTKQPGVWATWSVYMQSYTVFRCPQMFSVAVFRASYLQERNLKWALFSMSRPRKRSRRFQGYKQNHWKKGSI